MSLRNIVWISVVMVLATLALVLTRWRTITVYPQRYWCDPAVDELNGAIRAYEFIKHHSYFKVSPDKASRGAIEGMVRRIDKYAVYIPPDEEILIGMPGSGRRFGTGLMVAAEDDKIVVIGSLPDSPAYRAGLFAPMEVISINGISAKYLSEEQAQKILQPTGKDGKDNEVVVALRRLRSSVGSNRVSEIIVKRLKPERLKIRTVRGIVRGESNRWQYILDKKRGIYYLRISEFLDSTPTELQEAYCQFDNPNGLILDLRDNPGGTLLSAVAVCDRFLSKGLIVQTVDRNGNRQPYYAHVDGTYPPIPMVVLINHHTASAAEIVAGALKIHNRAVIVGQESYGKWFIQKMFDLGKGLGKVYLTVGEYFLTAPAHSVQEGTTTMKSSGMRRPETAPATSRSPLEEHFRRKPNRHGVRPDFPLRLTVASKKRLAILRLRAMVAIPPVDAMDESSQPKRPKTSSSVNAHAAKLMREILEVDEQLALALRILSESIDTFIEQEGEDLQKWRSSVLQERYSLEYR